MHFFFLNQVFSGLSPAAALLLPTLPLGLPLPPATFGHPRGQPPHHVPAPSCAHHWESFGNNLLLFANNVLQAQPVVKRGQLLSRGEASPMGSSCCRWDLSQAASVPVPLEG